MIHRNAVAFPASDQYFRFLMFTGRSQSTHSCESTNMTLRWNAFRPIPVVGPKERWHSITWQRYSLNPPFSRASEERHYRNQPVDSQPKTGSKQPCYLDQRYRATGKSSSGTRDRKPVPGFYPRYLSIGVVQTVLRAMTEFDTKGAQFTPCWRENGLLKLDASGNRDVLLAVWQRGRDILAVLANVGNASAAPRLTWEGADSARTETLFTRTKPLPEHIKPGEAVEIEVEANTFILARLTCEP